MSPSFAHGRRLALNTQTPLVRFRPGADPAARSLAELVEGQDYKLTTGGVTRMLLPLLHDWRASRVVADAEWVAMGAEATERRIEHDGIQLRFVGLPPDLREGYARVKERMWHLLNSNPAGEHPPRGEGGLPESAWDAFQAYQVRSADALARASERLGGTDLVYVHDFQQLGVAAAWQGPRVPRIFHLHTPFPSVLPPGWNEYFAGHLDLYDAVIVSTRRYAENLRAAGVRRPIHVVRPFIDPRSYRQARERDERELRERFGIPDGDRIILHVGRMDPMKGQDRLLRAFPDVLRAVPDARLLLVGNGSFSSSKRGGLGLSKGERWRAQLEELTAQLGLEERVTFTGHLGEEDLAAAYRACEVFALPSTREGFGLAAIEAWRNGKPVVVCDRAGVSELVRDGENGFVVDCADAEALADALLRLLRDPYAAADMGEQGLADSGEATIDVGRRALQHILDGVLAEAPHVRA